MAGALIAEEAQSAIAETSRAQLWLIAATSGDEREVAKNEMLSGLKTLDVLLGDTRLIANNAVVEARIQHKKAQEMSLAYIELVLKQPLDPIHFDASVSLDGRFLAEQMQQLTKAVRQLKEQQLTQARATMTSALNSQRTAQFLMVGLLGLSLIAAIAMAYMFARHVRSELGREAAIGSTQENSAPVARATAASAPCNQAEGLASDVRAFKLDEASDYSFVQNRFDKPDSSMPVLA
jgi:methyl-accepting chemotaxis protein